MIRKHFLCVSLVVSVNGHLSRYYAVCSVGKHKCGSSIFRKIKWSRNIAHGYGRQTSCVCHWRVAIHGNHRMGSKKPIVGLPSDHLQQSSHYSIKRTFSASIPQISRRSAAGSGFPFSFHPKNCCTRLDDEKLRREARRRKATLVFAHSPIHSLVNRARQHMRPSTPVAGKLVQRNCPIIEPHSTRILHHS